MQGDRDLLGLTPSGADALELLTVVPMGRGAVVLFRQRFGDLAAAVDGILSVGVRDGAVWHVSSSLARDGAAPAPATLSAADAERAALGDAGVAGAKVLRTQLVAVPTAAAGARAAYEVDLGRGPGGEPVGYSSYVDGRDRAMLVREGLVDFDVNNPEWAVFPDSPPGDSRRPTRGCAGAAQRPPAAPGGRHAARRAVGHRGGDQPADQHLARQQRQRRAQLGSTTRRGRPGRPPPARPRYAYPFTNQWLQRGAATRRCSPRPSATTPTRRRRTCSPCTTGCTTGRTSSGSPRTRGTSRPTTTAGGRGGAERRNEQAGGISGARPGAPQPDNANQVTGRDGVAADHQHVPVAAERGRRSTRMRRRRLRHDGDRATSHPRHHQPDDRRAQRRAQLARRADRWVIVGRPDGLEYLFQHGSRGRRTRLSSSASTSPAIRSAASATTTSPTARSTTRDVGYSTGGPAVHADGKIWRRHQRPGPGRDDQRYGLGTPRSRKSCAKGHASVDRCPGNRRWSQLVFDSFLLMAASQVSLVDCGTTCSPPTCSASAGRTRTCSGPRSPGRGMGAGRVSNGAA